MVFGRMTANTKMFVCQPSGAKETNTGAYKWWKRLRTPYTSIYTFIVQMVHILDSKIYYQNVVSHWQAHLNRFRGCFVRTTFHMAVTLNDNVNRLKMVRLWNCECVYVCVTEWVWISVNERVSVRHWVFHSHNGVLHTDKTKCYRTQLSLHRILVTFELKIIQFSF